ncbi:MAG: alkaline phosphatase [Hellea sp.]|nr:alkaline phosphatase [Hellea sp.]
MSISRKFSQSAFLFAFGLLSVALGGCADSADRSQKSNIKTTSASKAQNVILFIGDGMGVSTVTAGRIFVGQEQGKLGEEHVLSFETFDNVALVKTYNTNAQVPDSAGTATAIMSGYKTNIGTVNVEPGKELQGCGDIPGKPTFAQIASDGGKSVGIISTARITHATPAAVFGYADSRDWEADKDIPEKVIDYGCQSLAAQLVDADTPVNLALGGGAKEFSDIQFGAWDEQGENHVVVKTGVEFSALAASDTQDVLGLFTPSHLSFEADRDPAVEPSLAEMTAFAIDNLSARDTDGYVLMVEAGRIDHAHHGANAYGALKDFQALDEAVAIAIKKTGDDTLILVTADHSHVFTIAGYPKRGNPILGLVSPSDYIAEKMDDDKRYMKAKDGKPYTTLGYHNGGGEVRTPDSPALTDNEVQAREYRQQVAVPMYSETHAGEDVPLYATGPGADAVRGVMEQNEVHSVMVKAMGLE